MDRRTFIAALAALVGAPKELPAPRPVVRDLKWYWKNGTLADMAEHVTFSTRLVSFQEDLGEVIQIHQP